MVSWPRSTQRRKSPPLSNLQSLPKWPQPGTNRSSSAQKTRRACTTTSSLGLLHQSVRSTLAWGDKWWEKIASYRESPVPCLIWWKFHEIWTGTLQQVHTQARANAKTAATASTLKPMTSVTLTRVARNSWCLVRERLQKSDGLKTLMSS